MLWHAYKVLITHPTPSWETADPHRKKGRLWSLLTLACHRVNEPEREVQALTSDIVESWQVPTDFYSQMTSFSLWQLAACLALQGKYSHATQCCHCAHHLGECLPVFPLLIREISKLQSRWTCKGRSATPVRIGVSPILWRQRLCWFIPFEALAQGNGVLPSDFSRSSHWFASTRTKTQLEHEVQAREASKAASTAAVRFKQCTHL